MADFNMYFVNTKSEIPGNKSYINLTHVAWYNS